MKKMLSLCLAVLLLASSVPTAYAAEDRVDWGTGTEVVYEAANNEAYTVTVPALLAPGGNGEVKLQGTWPNDRVVSVTADLRVVLKNDIITTERKSLKVTFPGIAEYGSNTESQTFTETVSVADITGALFGKWTGTFNYKVEMYDGVDRLQAENEFAYYSTINLAVADVNGETIGVNADSDKDAAGAGVYKDNAENVYVVLLKDTELTESIVPAKNMTINLGGHTLSATDLPAIIVIGENNLKTNCNLVVDGRLPDSTISVTQTASSNNTVPIYFKGTVLTVKGGTYISNTVAGSNAACIDVQAGTGSIENAKVMANSDTTNSTARAIRINGSSTTGSVINCECIASAPNGTAVGIQTQGNVNVEDCDITVSAGNNPEGIKATSTASVTATNSSITVAGNNINGYAYGINLSTAASSATITECDISVTPEAATGNTFGIYAQGSAEVKDSGITASGGSTVAGYSGTVTVTDCDITPA